MRILIVGPYPPPPDGIGEHSSQLAAAWATAGHEVHALCRGDSSLPDRDEGDGVVIWRRLDHRGARAVATARDLRPDIVFVPFAIAALGAHWRPALAATAAARQAGATSIVAYHEATRDVRVLPGAGQWIYRRVSQNADRHVTFSSAASATLAELGIGPVRELVLGIPRPGSSTSHAGPTDLLALGFIHPDKGTDLLLRAMALLPDSEDRALLVAGSVRARRGPFRLMEMRDRAYERRLRRLAADLRTGTVAFRPFVPDHQLPDLLTTSRGLVLPYRRSTQSGVANLALAYQLPVIASDLPGLRDGLGAAALYFKPGDPRDLARALVEADRADARRRLRHEAHALADRDSVSAVADKILADCQ